jgi:hypothetical protein
MVTGRFNSMLGGIVDLYSNEDFRGVTIRNNEDSLPHQAWSVVKHIVPMPMSFSGMKKAYDAEGITSTMALSMFGIQDAPAAAKRTNATNLAFELSRKEYKGKEVTEEEMDLKDNLKRAMAQYARGDSTRINELRKNGMVSDRQYQIALTRYPVIDNQPNPLYKDQLSTAVKRLTVKSALKVFAEMTDTERANHSAEIQKKINNMKNRKDAPREKQKEFIDRWNDFVGTGSQYSVAPLVG